MTKNLTLTWSATALTAALVLAGCASSDNDDPADPAP